MLKYKILLTFIDTKGELHVYTILIVAPSPSDAYEQAAYMVGSIIRCRDWMLVDTLVLEKLDTRS